MLQEIQLRSIDIEPVHLQVQTQLIEGALHSKNSVPFSETTAKIWHQSPYIPSPESLVIMLLRLLIRKFLKFMPTLPSQLQAIRIPTRL